MFASNDELNSKNVNAECVEHIAPLDHLDVFL